MEIPSVENSQASILSSNDVGHYHENQDNKLTNDGIIKDVEMKCEITEEELRGILEVIASTGKFWHDWDTLKSFLSLRLKQVLAEYSETQTVSFGETYAELAKRLDLELCSFIDGPPFTLQRLCEILLDARSVYSNLSKLALALEKNLLVTSSLTICMDPYPSPPYDKLGKGSLESLPISTSPTQGGVEAMEVADEDEEMTDAEKMDEDNKNESKEDSVDNGNNSESKEFVDDADKKNHKAKYEADKKEEGSVDEVNKESVDEAEKEKNKESASTPIPGNTTSAISETSSGQSTSSNEISKDDPSPSSDDLHYTSL